MTLSNKLLTKALNLSHYKFIYEKIKNIKKINILEFGVRQGISTSMFLFLCNKNLGKLVSVDVENCSKLFINKKWTFLLCRDDDFSIVKKNIKKKLDVIFIDSYHDPDHIKKIIFYYYKYLKKNGYLFIDDISWIPYVKKSYRENSWNEITNRRTFSKLIEIYFQNLKNLSLEFSFDNSGIAMFKKISNARLIEPKKIFNSELTFKNILIRSLLKRKPQK